MNKETKLTDRRIDELHPIYHNLGTTVINLAAVDCFSTDGSHTINIHMGNDRLHLQSSISRLSSVIAKLTNPSQALLTLNNRHRVCTLDGTRTPDGTSTIDITTIKYIEAGNDSMYVKVYTKDGELKHFYGYNTEMANRLLNQLLEHDKKRVEDITATITCTPTITYTPTDEPFDIDITPPPHRSAYAININYIQMAMLDGDKIIITWTNRELRDELEFSSNEAASDYFNNLLTSMSALRVIPNTND